MLENVASTSKGSCAGARCGMVPKHIQGLPAPVGARVLPAAGGCERERKAQATPQGQVHVLWAERGARVGRDGRQPRRGLRPGLGAEQGLAVWREVGEHVALSEAGVESESSGVLPPVWPDAWFCIC